MGCGSSKAVVAVAPPPSTPGKTSKRVPSAKDSVKNFQASSSRDNIKENSDAPVRVSSKSSVKDIVPERTESRKSLRSNKTVDRLKSGTSVHSTDSGVFDDRTNSSSTRTSKSNSRIDTPELERHSVSSGSNRVATPNKNNHPSTPTRKSRSSTPDLEVTESSSRKSSANSRKSSSKARSKLLRIESTHESAEDDQESNGNKLAPELSMVSRPKSRFGNVAFDLEFPETNNMRKKQPLPRIKRSGEKKRRTREDIDRKMNEVAERRKLAELEKLMKAKRAQHSILNTPVEPFNKSADSEELEQSMEHNADVVDSVEPVEQYLDSIDTVAIANEEINVDS